MHTYRFSLRAFGFVYKKCEAITETTRKNNKKEITFPITEK